MKIKITLLAIIVGLLALLGVFAFINQKNTQGNNVASDVINNFEECAEAGYPIMESYPEQCKTPDGRTFAREVKSSEYNFGNPIQLSINQNIVFDDGLSVTLAEINDSRCKEGTVCVWAGELSPKFSIIGGGIGQSSQEIILGTVTKNNTTINGYTFILQTATEATATIIVSKQSLEITCATDAKICPDGSSVGRIAPNCEFAPCPDPLGACYVGGCSSQICSDQKDVVSTCEYKEAYACYKTATCARQANGQCGWTQTAELTACLAIGLSSILGAPAMLTFNR